MTAVVPLVLAVAGLAGCATTTPHPVTSAPMAQPQPHLTVATPTASHDAMAQLMDGQFDIDHNHLKAAAKAYAKAAAISDDPKVAGRATELALATHDTAGARMSIARWAALGASAADLDQARAKLALQTGDTVGARAQLEKLVASGDKNAWRRFGRLLMNARDAAQAGQLLEAIATPARLPNDAKAWLAMSELGEKLGRHAYAGNLAKQAIVRFHCADCYAWAAQLQFQIGHHKQARALYAKAVAKDPRNKQLRQGYASLLGQIGDDAAAARVLARGPQDATTYPLRAAYAARGHDTAELKRIYRDLQRAPASVREPNQYLLGQLAGSLGHLRQAIDWFGKVPPDGEHGFDAQLQSAILWQQLGKMSKAQAIAQQMQSDHAGDPKQLGKALQLSASLYMMSGDYAKAIASLNDALKLAPDDSGLLYNRGVAYAEAGDTDAAITDLRHVLKIKPDDIDAVNALGFTLADANRNLSEAEKLIARAHAAQPDNPSITDSWGWVQYRLGHLATARKALEQAWKKGKDPQVGGHLATVLWQQGDHRQARDVIDAARKLAPHDAVLRALQQKFTP
ncbi:MAG TPA: tetratricopeptide repeat protein [Rhodanobacteraceae bacterium]